MPRLTLRDFDYDLPPELIAQVPARERTASRLLHVDGTKFADLAFTDLPRLVAPGDLLVFNDTRVIKSRLIAAKPTGGRVELLLERLLGPHEALFQLRASHPPKPGGLLLLPGEARAEVMERRGRFFVLHLAGDVAFLEYLDRHGAVPLPPYIERPADAGDESRYQTVYARHAGAVAAPTAGLHFDAALLAALEKAGAHFAYVTLHVGAGTFAAGDARGHRHAHDAPRVVPRAGRNGGRRCRDACGRRPRARRRHDQRPCARVGRRRRPGRARG